MIYDIILACAREKNLSIREIERLAGFSNGTISKWEKSNPTVDRLYKVAKILEKPIEYFLKEGD